MTWVWFDLCLFLSTYQWRVLTLAALTGATLLVFLQRYKNWCLDVWGKTNKHKGFKVLSPHAAVQSRNSWVVFVEAFVTDDSTEKSVGVEVDDLGRRRRREAVAERHRLPLEPEQVWDKIVYGLNIFVREPFWDWKNGTAGTKAAVLQALATNFPSENVLL